MKKTPIIEDNSPGEEAEIQRQIAEDSDVAEISPTARVLKRGRPAGQTKEQVTVRLDKDVLAALKRPDPKGWQTRLNAVLRSGLKL